MHRATNGETFVRKDSTYIITLKYSCNSMQYATLQTLENWFLGIQPNFTRPFIVEMYTADAVLSPRAKFKSTQTHTMRRTCLVRLSEFAKTILGVFRNRQRTSSNKNVNFHLQWKGHTVSECKAWRMDTARLGTPFYIQY